MRNHDSEDALETAAVDLFREMGYETLYAFEEINGAKITGRETLDEVVLLSRLRPALERLNPNLPASAIEAAIAEITRDRSLMTPENANREVYSLLKNGVKVTFRDEEGGETEERVRVIDWGSDEQNELPQNDYLLVQQFWAVGPLYTRRADLVAFVNGLPLVFIELKASHRRVDKAYRDNLRDYRDTIPHIFWYNALIILSNGFYSRVGSLSADWEHFTEWKKINDEGEEGRISLETILRGTCDPERLLDLIENFTLFSQSKGGLIKIIAKNHQYLGVNNTVRAVQNIRHNQGRLGVFWHTQGSGKSYSMVFFAQKILRKLPGNWTFVIVTDRDELDDQIYKTFADVGAVPPVKGRKGEVQAESGEALKRLLWEDHRYVFTLIQKFHTRDGQPYPVLSERSDVIVMTDEAHRSQYDLFAANMRAALPNAAFIGFTGTPLMVGEEKTKEVFGDYVSIYNFRQSVEDSATVPLFYENRIPQLELTNLGLNKDVYTVLDNAMLDDEQESRLEREFAREYHLITREDRLEAISKDIVDHYMARGYAGRDYNSKAMVVCIDKLTAVKMYDKVKQHWAAYEQALQTQLKASHDSQQRQELETQLDFMRETDMAVVISQSQNEIADFRARGLDILTHRTRMQREDLDTKFKEPKDKFRIVFVCAMWMTGFDVPSCATIYLDKPMRNHTLMQTIARANRVFQEKRDGLIVDYVGIFRRLEQALAIYGSAVDGGTDEGEMPIQAKRQRVEQLERVIGEAKTFCRERGVDLDAIQAATGFDREKLKKDAVEAILAGGDDAKQRYFALVREINRLYKSILPHRDAFEFDSVRRLLGVVAEAIIVETTPEIDGAEIADVQGLVEDVLDESILTAKFVIHEPVDANQRLDLSQIDFDALKARFEAGYKRTAIERLQGEINRALQRMVRHNRTRMDYLETFQQMIGEYNTGAANLDVLFHDLVTFVKTLDDEERRGLAEQLTEEELAVFDLLIKPTVELTAAERETVKAAARELLAILKQEKLVLDWRKRQQTRAAVLTTIRDVLDRNLPSNFSQDLFQQKVDVVYQHIHESYYGAGRSIYSPAA